MRVYPDAILASKHCSDYDTMAELLVKFDLPVPSSAAVYKWRIRGTIPGEALLNLLLAIEMEEGTPVSLRDLATKENNECGVLKGKSCATGSLLATFG